ncbi:MAG TPA: exodeoxyribonuclease VII small subunit [Clostridia bacterium]|nr:exodeoxyribonuclease VII small subunit [Clostridia bacterium]
MSFEEAINKLEGIVQSLETGNISLDESLRLFQEGVQLIDFCQKKLTMAEQKVSVLVQKNEEIFLEPFTNEDYKE